MSGRRRGSWVRELKSETGQTSRGLVLGDNHGEKISGQCDNLLEFNDSQKSMPHERANKRKRKFKSTRDDNDDDTSNEKRHNQHSYVDKNLDGKDDSAYENSTAAAHAIDSRWTSTETDDRQKQQANPMLRSRVHLLARGRCKIAKESTVDYDGQTCSLSSTASDRDLQLDENYSISLGTIASPLVHGDHRSLCPHFPDRPDKSRQVDKNNNNNNDNAGYEQSFYIDKYSSSVRKFSESRSDKKIYQCSESGSAPSSGLLTDLLNSLLELIYLRNQGDSRARNLHEWQQDTTQQGGETKKSAKQEFNQLGSRGNMPNQSIYGTTSGQEGRRNSSRRFRDPNGYSRLGYNHYQKSTQQTSILQELKRLLLLIIIVAICGVVLWQIYEVLIDEDTNYLGVVKQSPSVLGKFNHYAVSTDAKPCSKVGKDLLAKGGHAVDAAIGTLICMGVVLPNSLGLGGGCLMTIYDNVTKQAIVIDGREEAPNYAHENMFNASKPLAASRGPASVGVPGELAAYWEAHKRFGRLKWAELFEESIRMAEQGSPTVEHLAFALRHPNHAIHITPPLRQIMWNNATGDYVNENEILVQPMLAESLKRIRDNGASEFYGGQTGSMFIEDLKRQGGQMNLENLVQYKARVRNATFVDLNEHVRVYTQPIPGSGLVLSIILRIMRKLGYYKNEQPKRSFEAAGLYYHHLVEAYKFAYAQRGALEDLPDDPIRMEKLVARLESEEFIEQAVGKIKADRTLPSKEYGGLGYFQEDHGTAHVSVLDAQGNTIAVTSSVNLYFGSGLVSPSTGIIYNDVMDDFVSPNITNKFNLVPSKFNMIRPGRRPLSSMAPSVFVDSLGNPTLIIGASGGSMITSSIATVSLRNIFMSESIKTAIDASRLHHQYLPEKLQFESNFPPELLGALTRRGHEAQKITGRSSVVMAIACEYRNNGTQKYITANSDYRKGGSVDGL